MKVNPVADAWTFLIGATGDQVALGVARYGFVALFLGLLAGSLLIARACWRADPAQRSTVHLWTWLCRVLIGCMWFQGALWKLPLPVSGGLQYWTEQMVQYAAFPFAAALVREVMLPHLAVLDPLIFLAELGMALSYMLGLAVRPVAVLGALYALGLWVGLYRHPTEWPWEYIFLAAIQGMFAAHAAGRSLGLDALLSRTARRMPRKKAP